MLGGYHGCYCYLRNIEDLLSDGKTLCERRFEDQSRIHQFGKKVLPGLFLGYALYAGGIWEGDMLVADIEELETMDASEIYSKRLNAKEVIFPKENDKFIFPAADGQLKLTGGDQVLRASILIRDSPERGEEREDLRGESDGSPPHDSFPDAGEAINDFWSMLRVLRVCQLNLDHFPGKRRRRTEEKVSVQLEPSFFQTFPVFPSNPGTFRRYSR